MTLTYQLAEGPDVICSQMLQGCAKQALEKLEKNTTEGDSSKWAEASRMGWATSLCCVFLKGREVQPTPSPFVEVDDGLSGP